MAHLDLEEQEQLAQLKSWWATYGSFLVTLLVGAALGFSAWQGWRYWQGSQSANASALFETLTKGLQAADAKAVRDSSGELLEKYAGTQYAAMGALSSARFFFRQRRPESREGAAAVGNRQERVGGVSRSCASASGERTSR